MRNERALRRSGKGHGGLDRRVEPVVRRDGQREAACVSNRRLSGQGAVRHAQPLRQGAAIAEGGAVGDIGLDQPRSGGFVEDLCRALINRGWGVDGQIVHETGDPDRIAVAVTVVGDQVGEGKAQRLILSPDQGVILRDRDFALFYNVKDGQTPVGRNGLLLVFGEVAHGKAAGPVLGQFEAVVVPLCHRAEPADTAEIDVVFQR